MIPEIPLKCSNAARAPPYFNTHKMINEEDLRKALAGVESPKEFNSIPIAKKLLFNSVYVDMLRAG